MAERVLESPPAVPWARLLLKRGRGLQEGEPLPRLESVLTRPDTSGADAFCTVVGQPRGEHLPLLWPHLMAGSLHLDMLAHPDFPLAGLGMVHVANQIVQRRPLRRDEPLTVRCAWEGWERVKRGAEITLSTRVEVKDEVPWEERSVFLSQAVRGAGEQSREDPEPLSTVARSCLWRVPADQGRRYAAVSGDYNLIHIHPWGAKLFGFKRTIVHGMWTLARAVAEMDPPEGAWELEGVFRRPVLLPGEVHFESGPEGEFRVRRPKDGKVNLYGRLRRWG